FFPLSAAREETFAAGLSMGGYGALRLALAKPDRFAAAARLSGALHGRRVDRNARRSGSGPREAEVGGRFGTKNDPTGTSADLWHLSDQLAASSQPRPALFLACGTEDELLAENQNFHSHLLDLGLPHSYSESPGAHEWSYWDEQICRVLDWLPKPT